MGQKHKRINRYSLSALAVLILAGAAYTILIIKPGTTDTTEPPTGAAVPSQFTFTGAANWWQGATRKTDMALFHTIPDSCFVSAQHLTGSMDAKKAKLQKSNASLVADGYTVTSGATQTVTVQTAKGQQSYQLEQASVTSPAGASTVDGGQEYGYLPLSARDYLYFEGHCETAGELAATIPALEAIKFSQKL